eukprot:12556706-Ditylum_brightwellii.AAC.1
MGDALDLPSYVRCMGTGENSAWMQFIALSAPGKIATLVTKHFCDEQLSAICVPNDKCELRKGSGENVETGSPPHVEEMSVEKAIKMDDVKVSKNIWNNMLKKVLLYEEDKPWIKAFDTMRRYLLCCHQRNLIRDLLIYLHKEYGPKWF